ncbi:tetratricopeptide repeat protein [Saccharicrinis sp. FJH54]|uniref:tetratricopeptide repeat protein n=1 Tax=Saccharicrinis sp. FJH54 TaxID=3344665 RepID=UPI0035D4D326
MKKKLSFISFILLVYFSFQGQIQNSLIVLSPEEREELLELTKELYLVKCNISMNLSRYDLMSSFEDMPDVINYDKKYLESQLSIHKNDTTNPFTLINIAEYYKHIYNYKMAMFYYEKTYNILNISYFNNDSASFYAFRGVLKSELGDSTASKDFDSSAEINPNDSILLCFYPRILISNGEFDKAREIILLSLNTNSSHISLSYLCLSIIEVFENLSKLSDNEESDIYRQKNRTKNFDKIVDYKLLDRYASVYRDNQEIKNCRMIADIYGLMCKMFLFEISDDKFLFSFKRYEIHKMQKILDKLATETPHHSLNQYTLNKCKGYLYLMQQEWDKSIDYFHKAIDIFPIEKKNEYFNTDECYEAIKTIYIQLSDTSNYIKTINQKLANENVEERKTDDLTSLAFIYFQSGKIKEAEKYCQKALSINSNNCDALRLISHINFLRNSYLLSQFYGECAGNSVRNDDDCYNVYMQFAIYCIYTGNFKDAEALIGNAQQIKGKNNCPLCDKLLSKYGITK